MRTQTWLILLCAALALAACSTQPAATPPAAAVTTDTAAATATETTTVETATVETATVATATPETAVASPATTGSDPLLFPVDDYVEETTTVTTTAGAHEVTYRLYQHIPYVANPVDTDYQSLDVKVPVAVDGAAVDATNAPILLAIGVGGYMSVNNASGGSMGGGMGAMGPGAGITGTLPGGITGTMPAGMMGGLGGDASGVSGAADLALAAGYVVVDPGVRGRDNQADDGTYFGKAPAAIVDLKAVVRYIRHNQGVLPGNTDWIISRGVSAGGALSALLGASGDSDLYDTYLEQLGAADASDAIYASADFCPITDLEHADMAYEWSFGSALHNGALVDQDLSQQLAAAFSAYQATLALEGANNFGTLSADTFGDYLVQTYLAPAATTYLQALSDDERSAYLAEHAWITWSDAGASFTFADFAASLSRKKDVPSFDAFDLSAGENSLFGTATTNARHFTEFGATQGGADASGTLDDDIPTLVTLMNPMYFINQAQCAGCAEHWWLRVGSADTDTSLTVISNLAASLDNQGKDVNGLMYWDAGHGADEDPEAFITWIGQITGYAQ